MQTTTEPLFESSHDALLFAFNYQRALSPRSPLAGLAKSGGQLGRGRGLVGIEAAAQAGIILAAYATLAKDHQHVLRVRFGRNEQPCPHCATIAPCTEWIEAVDALSRTPDLDGVQRTARHLMVEKAVCGLKGTSVATIAANFQLVERTLQKQMAAFRKRMTRLECEALDAADNALRDKGVVG